MPFVKSPRAFGAALRSVTLCPAMLVKRGGGSQGEEARKQHDKCSTLMLVVARTPPVLLLAR